jgi:hypothetical protein
LRLRRLAVLACLALVFVVAPHATLDVIQLGRDHGADCALVVCLLVFTAVGVAVTRAAPFPSFLLLAAAPLNTSSSRLATPSDDRARASPLWLQRFLR